ncbi:hypothetical protein [Microbacterium sp. bgisy189]|uniref:hypothetical protein n=1 Tax=Microbacterium sp. bgisy189 TaxID=3413798 RepID=UPI003EC100B2
MTENVLVPVNRFITEAREACETMKRKIEEQVSKPIEDWVEKTEERCKKNKCKWWCACCNKWFCWLVTIVVRVVTWVVVTIVKWVSYLVCKIVTVVVGVVVDLVLKVITRVVTFLVCLFTDPLRALSALWDLVNDVFDAVGGLLDLVVDLIGDIASILREAGAFLAGIGMSFCIYGKAMCSVFGAIFGAFKGLLDWAADVVDWIQDTVQGVVDLVMGILSLDWCRIQKGLGIFNVLRVITSVTRVLGSVFYVGPAEQLARDDLARLIDGYLGNTFGDDPERRERSRARIGLDGELRGVPMAIEPHRLAIRSGDFLHRLHREGAIDLYAVAGRFTSCQGKWTGNQFEGEVVYTGTTSRVTKTDLDTFLSDGADAVASFTVYALKTQTFRRRLELTARKGTQVGVRFTFGDVADLLVTEPRYVPLDAGIDDGSVQTDLLREVGRAGEDDLSRVPLIAVFGYVDTGLHGLATWYRPDLDAVGPSGVTFRDRFPETVFQYVPPHEVGHYVGLDHDGHTHPGEIMWKPNLGTEWGPTLVNYLLTTGEANFTADDADAVWRWITATPRARDDILP